jgi:putative peptidoglycan lipid II flippase
MDNNQNRLLKASVIVTVISIIGKFLGFARDAVIAAFYGANWQTDAFFFAQSMPGIIFPAVCNSLSTAFLTAYVAKSVEDRDNADLYASKAISFSFILAITLSGIAIIITPFLVPFFAPGFSTNQTALAIHLTRITMAAFVLAMGQYMLSAVLSAKKQFYGAQIAALVYNFTVIAITIVIGRSQNMDALTGTVVLGHIVQLIILFFIARKRFKFSVSIRVFNSDTKTLIKLTLPILLGNSIVQINNIVDKVLSSLFSEGAMSALSYANTLNRFITGVVITTLSTVIYPILAEHYSKGEDSEFSQTVRKSIIISLMVLLPVSLITTLCASDIVDIVYVRGEFNIDASTLTSSALAFYGMMYVFSAVQEVIVRAFYSMKDTKTPLKTAALAILSNAIMSYLFSRVFGMGLAGIALGTTLSTLLAASLLIFALKKRVHGFALSKLIHSFSKILLSAIVLLGGILFMRKLFTGMIPLLRFIMITIISFAIHLGVLALTKCDEISEAKQLLCKALKRHR